MTRSANQGRVFLRCVPPLALAGYATCVLCLWTEPGWRPEWDSALYILTGRSLAEGAGYRYLGEPFVLRPPGFPWLLSLASQGPFDPARLNRLVMGFAAASAVAVWFALSRGRGPWLALAAALLAGTSPLGIELFNWVLSEFPFMTLLYLGLGCFRAPASGVRGRLTATLTALALAAAFWIRSIALLVVPGLLWLAFAEPTAARRRRAAFVLVGVLALCLPWWLLAWAAPWPAELADQLLLADYATALLHVAPGDPTSDWISLSGWLSRIQSNGESLLRAVARTTLGTTHLAAGALVTGLVLAGVLRALRREASILEWFAIAYGALVLGYFTFDARLVTPVLPLLYLYLLGAVGALGHALLRLAPRLPARELVLGATFVGLLVANGRGLPRALDARSWPLAGGLQLGKEWNDGERVAAWIREHTPSDAVILCHDAPVQALLTGRRVLTHRFRPGPRLLRKYQPDFVVFDRRSRQDPPFAGLVASRATQRWSVPSDRHPGGIAVYAMPKPAQEPR